MQQRNRASGSHILPFFTSTALEDSHFKNIGSSIEDVKNRPFASCCSHLLRLLWRFSLGTWISLIMIAASWWLDISMPAYSTALPSAIWTHSVLLPCTTSLRTGPLWAIDSSLFKWAEANASPSQICRGCMHPFFLGNCSVLIVRSMLIMSSDGSLSLIS